jgi:hypothetical protein
MMLHAVEELRGATSEGELGERLGVFLGLTTAAPLPVVRRAIIDPRFCGYLVASRGRPDVLKVLCADPANGNYEDEPLETVAAPARVATERSNLSLVIKAGVAVARWAASDFSRVDDTTFEARFNACVRCDQLVAPPDKFLYKVRLSARSDQRVCNACGCGAARKAKLATEHCPLADPLNPGFNRWGEPMKEAHV